MATSTNGTSWTPIVSPPFSSYGFSVAARRILPYAGSSLISGNGAAPINANRGIRFPVVGVTGTSLVGATGSYGTHYNITNSQFSTLTLPAVNWGVDYNGYWVFRNNTSSYLSVNVSYSSAGTTAPTNPVVIPPSNSTTIMVTYPSGTTSNYVLF